MPGRGLSNDLTWPPDLLDVLQSSGSLRDFPKGAHLIRQGDDTSTVFLLLDGACAVMAGGTTRRVLEAGELVGELSYLVGRPRSADVIALRSTSAIAVEPAALDLLAEQQPALMATYYWICARQLARRVVTTDRDV